MNNKLPVKEIFLEALTLPQKYFKNVTKAGLPLILVGILYIGLMKIAAILYEKNLISHDLDAQLFTSVIGVISALFFLLLLVIGIISCHRIFLMKDVKIRIFNWTGNELKYIGWCILIGLCSSAINIPITIAVSPFLTQLSFEPELITIISIIISLPIYYFIARWSLALPACSVDNYGKGIFWSWNLSKGNDYRLAFLIGFIPILVNLFFGLLPKYDSIFFTTFYYLLWLYIAVIQIGLLSLSYKFLIEHEKEILEEPLEEENKDKNDR